MIPPSVFESYQVNRRNGWEVSSEVYYTIYWSLSCSRKSALAVEVYRSNDSLSAGGGMSLLALLLRNRNIWEATILYSINFSWSIEIEITEVYVYRLSVQTILPWEGTSPCSRNHLCCAVPLDRQYHILLVHLTSKSRLSNVVGLEGWSFKNSIHWGSYHA